MSDNTNPDVSDKDLEIAAFIREQMGQHGWEGEKSRINPFILGTLEVDSAVGAKRGSAQWQHWKKDQVYSIDGQFYSEGRNVCEAVHVSFPENAGFDLIAEKVDEFCVRFRKYVDESYAVRLTVPDEQDGPR